MSSDANVWCNWRMLTFWRPQKSLLRPTFTGSAPRHGRGKHMSLWDPNPRPPATCKRRTTMQYQTYYRSLFRVGTRCLPDLANSGKRPELGDPKPHEANPLPPQQKQHQSRMQSPIPYLFERFSLSLHYRFHSGLLNRPLTVPSLSFPASEQSICPSEQGYNG